MFLFGAGATHLVADKNLSFFVFLGKISKVYFKKVMFSILCQPQA